MFKYFHNLGVRDLLWNVKKEKKKRINLEEINKLSKILIKFFLRKVIKEETSCRCNFFILNFMVMI